MTERIEKQMGIPLTEVSKFNVKRKLLIYKRDKTIETIPLDEAMRDYQRSECRHCGDFSAEMADIACGGVGTDAATIVVIRTAKGEALWRKFEAAGEVEAMPINENKRAWNILQRLARRQRSRVPKGAPRSGSAQGLPQYSPRQAADLSAAAADKGEDELVEMMQIAYGGDERPLAVVGYMAGQPIPGDPGPPPSGEKRKLPPPPAPADGGAPPGWDGE